MKNTIEQLKDIILLEEKSITNKNTESIIKKTKRSQKENTFLQNKKVL